MADGHLVSASDLQRIGRSVTDFERRRRQSGPKPTRQRQASGRPDILVLLLDFANSGDRVQAAVLEDRVTTETQTITAYGTPTGGYFRLGFRPSVGAEVEWTANIEPMKDDSATITSKLEALPSLAPGDVIVDFGVVTTFDDVEVRHWPNRWAVTFVGKLQGIDVPLLALDDHINDAEIEIDSTSILEDTGRVEWVREVLGVGVPTPIRAGARALCHWVSGVGYCLGSIEVRDYGDYGLQEPNQVQ